MTALDTNPAPASSSTPASVPASSSTPASVPASSSTPASVPGTPSVPPPASVLSVGARLPYAGREFRRIRALLGGHLAVSVLTVAAAAALGGRSSAVDSAVWIRSVLVAAGAVVLYACASRASRGSLSAYRRLHVLSAVTLAAIVAVVALPGTFPVWLKAEQAGCGAVVAAVVVLANSRTVRGAFVRGGAGAVRR